MAGERLSERQHLDEKTTTTPLIITRECNRFRKNRLVVDDVVVVAVGVIVVVDDDVVDGIIV